MAKNPKKPIAPTRKHLVKLEREKQQTRWIVLGTSIVLVLVAGLILFGILNDILIKPNRTVAQVNDDRILVKEFQGYTRFIRSTLIDSAIQTYQFLQFFGSEPETLASFAPQLTQFQAQLQPLTVGQQAIDQMVENLIIFQQAQKRGLSISESEINSQFEAVLGYFPSGTPTPTPTLEALATSTYSPLQLTALAPTATSVLTDTQELLLTPTEISVPVEPITPTATLAPTPSPTPYTEEGYQQEYRNILERYKEYGITENDLIYVIKSQLYRERLLKSFLEETSIPRTREEVWARHILVDSEESAQQVLSRLQAGEEWCSLAAELSTDQSNKFNCGDLGWFQRGQMVAPFESSAFSQPIGEYGNPTQSDFGWHLIQVLGRENRPIIDTEYQQLQDARFNEFIQTLRLESDWEIFDLWSTVTPDQPELPVEIQLFIEQFTTQNPSQPLP
jgi:peptidyl-prolyl cis-trans isomerase D